MAFPAFAPAFAGKSQQDASSGRKRVWAYVGSYSSPQDPEGSKGRGEGIYLFQMDSETGALQQREIFPNGSNPSWLAFDPSRKYLYAANEIQNFQGAHSGSV